MKMEGSIPVVVFDGSLECYGTSKLVATTHIVSSENSSLRSYPSARNGIYMLYAIC